MTEEQLVDNGYPQAGTELGAALIKREKLIEPVLVESLGSNGMSIHHIQWNLSNQDTLK